MTPEDWRIVGFTAVVAAFSTLAILPFALATAWVLARYDWRGKSILETCVYLPLSLPPVATGLILLKLLGRRGPLGKWLHDTMGMDIVFTWKAVIISLGVMSFPLLVRSARTAFEEVQPRLEQIARTLGASEWRVLYSITLPLSVRGILGGMLLAFARALGEFGATIMVAGNIPEHTTTLSLALFQSVELGDDTRAFKLLGISAVLAFAMVWTSEFLSRRKAK